MKPKRRFVWIGAALLLAVVGIASDRYRLWELWYHVMPRNLAVVEPDRLYRGAYQFPIPLRRIIRKYRFKAILAVRQIACPGEPEIAREFGLKYYVVPIARASQATNKQLDAAAAILANPDNHPIFFHCRGGRDRTNLALAAYRIRHCRWPLEKVVAELEPWGLHSPEHLQVLRRYYLHVQGTNQTASAKRSSSTTRAGRLVCNPAEPARTSIEGLR